MHQAGAQWKAWVDVLADFGGNRYEIPGEAWPEHAVDLAYINTRWIPLTHDGSGNHIGLDFDPWPSGRVGQVILFGRDEDVKAVLAETLGKFLEWIAGLLESGNFRLEAAEEPVLRRFRLKAPHQTTSTKAHQAFWAHLAPSYDGTYFGDALRSGIGMARHQSGRLHHNEGRQSQLSQGMKAYRREKGLAKRKGGIGSELALVVAQIRPEITASVREEIFAGSNRCVGWKIGKSVAPRG
nr:SMI1/KNR4 family protein [Mesorhizobium sp.]